MLRDVPPRQRILDSAATPFAHRGVRAVGVGAIIADAGVARASFYRHFRSKNDLVVAWLGSEQARWLDRFRTETQRRARSPSEQLDAFVDVVAESLTDPGYCGCPYLSVAAELRNAPGPVRDIIAGFWDD